MNMEFWAPLSPEAQVGVFAVQVLMMVYLSLSFLNKRTILKVASMVRSWLFSRGACGADSSDPLMIKKRVILKIRQALAPYVVAFVLWLTSLFVAGFVYSGWVLSNSLGTNFHFERHALACAMMLLCQSSGVALLCALRWKKANGVLLDLGYGMMMVFLSITTLPGVCPGEILTVVVCLAWIVRLALLPLANSMLWVMLANFGCSICMRLRLQRRILNHPGDLGTVAEQLVTVDLAVLALCCVSWLCAQIAMGANADQQMETLELKAESNACASLLATICDAHFFLNKQLNFEQHERNLSSILVQSSHTKDRSFAQFLATPQDQERFVRTAESARAKHSTLAQVMHVGMRDGLGNVIPVQVFHIALFDLKGEARHLVGVREYDDQVLWRGGSSFRPEKGDRAEGVGVVHSISADSQSSSSIDLDDNNECTIIFEPIDMEVLSASRFLMDCMGQPTAEGLAVIDLVYASDRHEFKANLINNVNEFMASGSESSSFEMSFRMKMRWGLTDTTWRCLLSNGDMLLTRAELIRIKKVRNSRGSASRGTRSSELGLVEELRPTVYGCNSL